MKRLYAHIKLAALSLLLFSACTQDESLPYGGENGSSYSKVLSIQNIEVANFAGESNTRVVNDGVTVTFEAGTSLADQKGDTIGILLIGADGKAIANVPFKYISEGGGNKWANMNQVPYSNKIGKAIAYFPYTEFTTIPTSVDELKQMKMNLNATATEFKHKDLLVAEINQVASADLSIRFTHAFSLIVLSGEKFIEVNGERISYSLSLSDVAFSIGEQQYTTDVMNGKYLCLMNGGTLTPDEFRYFYTVDNTPYVKTVKEAKTLLANHSYAFACPVSVSGAENQVSVGDFYCTSAKGNAVVIPGNAAVIPEGLTCNGIVFRVMNNSEFNEFAGINKITAADCPGYNSRHGLIASTQAGGPFGNVTWDNLKLIMENVADHDSKDVSNGYILTQTLLEAARQDNPVITLTGLNGHTDTRVKNATAWYLPSFHELRFMVQGASLETGSVAGQVLVNKQLAKTGGTQTAGTLPSVTIYKGDGDKGLCLMLNGAEHGWHGTTPGEVFRPVCAF